MTMAYLIDTNVVSELTRPSPAAGVVAFLDRTAELYLSVIVFHELEFGIQNTPDLPRRARLQSFSLALREQFSERTIPVDLDVAATAGRLRAFEKSAGRILTPLDSLIAATAMVKDHTLVTRNIRDFERLSIRLLDPWES
jgi:predicted nucleic acid-binding protein